MTHPAGSSPQTITATSRRTVGWSAVALQPLLHLCEHKGSPYYSMARLWDDGILKLTDTRQALALGITTSLNALIPEMKMGVVRM